MRLLFGNLLLMQWRYLLVYTYVLALMRTFLCAYRIVG